MPRKPLLMMLCATCLWGNVWSQRKTADTVSQKARQLWEQKKKQVADRTRSIQFPSKDSIRRSFTNAVEKPGLTKPSFSIQGGYISYQGNYRSVIDTPYAENNIVQHHIAGQLHLTAVGLPLQVNYWIRQSNSHFFKNIADVQVAFNGAAFRDRLQNTMRSKLLALAPTLADSLLEQLYGLKEMELAETTNELKTLFHPQKLIEANETLRVPKLTWDAGLPDSINLAREDSLKKTAARFLDRYNRTKSKYDQLNSQVDSLKKLYQHNLQKIEAYRQMVNGSWNDMRSSREWKSRLGAFGIDSAVVPARYRWLLGLRNFSIGRSPVNYSELTARNISANGINVEYNSWYYFAASAGTVNYRFRDFVVNGFNKRPQLLYLLRLGIGQLERNYFIVSGWHGQKQLFRNNANVNESIKITGISVATRWTMNRHTWMTAEVAKSMAPDYRNNPSQGNNKFDLSDKNSGALALYVYSYIPATRATLEGSYKHTGANFQSFSTYQTNAAQESWYIKGEQPFFKRQLRIAASLRKNEFSNPFVVQDYKSNTVFTSITASLRMRRWPVVTVGYQPLSQFTKVNNQVIESRFQTFNVTLYHQYALKQVQTATTILLNKFYNHNADTGFVYYNATNAYFTQHFFFRAFTANVGASYTKNFNYNLQVLEGGIQPNLGRLGTIGTGIKLNNLNRSVMRVGGYVTANIRVYKQDLLYLSYEYGYLPGNYGGLVRNVMGTIQFVKTFYFK